jgi:3-deoxy-D-manno-octulosonate 8-phosphate phosphatase KdsC-like HAD superfamily phosphatase
LKLACIQGLKDKGKALRSWASRNGLDLTDIAYLGNDIYDLEGLQIAGCGVVVQDSHPDVRVCPKIVAEKAGGHGVKRNIADLIMQTLTN